MKQIFVIFIMYWLSTDWQLKNHDIIIMKMRWKNVIIAYEQMTRLGLVSLLLHLTKKTYGYTSTCKWFRLFLHKNRRCKSVPITNLAHGRAVKFHTFDFLKSYIVYRHKFCKLWFFSFGWFCKTCLMISNTQTTM